MRPASCVLDVGERKGVRHRFLIGLQAPSIPFCLTSPPFGAGKLLSRFDFGIQPGRDEDDDRGAKNVKKRFLAPFDLPFSGPYRFNSYQPPRIAWCHQFRRPWQPVRTPEFCGCRRFFAESRRPVGVQKASDLNSVRHGRADPVHRTIHHGNTFCPQAAAERMSQGSQAAVRSAAPADGLAKLTVR